MHTYANTVVDHVVFDALRIFQRRHLMSFLCQYDQWFGYHGSIDACRYREDQVRRLFLISGGEKSVQEE